MNELFLFFFVCDMFMYELLLPLCRDNFLILQAFMGVLAYYLLPSLRELPKWDMRGVPVVILLHVLVSEPLFYWAHIFFHKSDYFYKHYHSVHHSSVVTQSYTGPCTHSHLFWLLINDEIN